MFRLFKAGVAFHYLTDMAIGDNSILGSEIPFQRVEEINGVNELDLTLPCLRFSIR